MTVDISRCITHTIKLQGLDAGAPVHRTRARETYAKINMAHSGTQRHKKRQREDEKIQATGSGGNRTLAMACFAESSLGGVSRSLVQVAR